MLSGALLRLLRYLCGSLRSLRLFVFIKTPATARTSAAAGLFTKAFGLQAEVSIIYCCVERLFVSMHACVGKEAS